MKQKYLFSDLIEEKPNFTETPLFRASVLVTIAILVFIGIAAIANTVFKKEAKRMPIKLLKDMSSQEMVREIQKLETNIKSKEGDIFKLVSSYKEKTGEDFPDVNLMGLSNREKDLFTSRVKAEKRVTIKSLLSEILKNFDNISQMKRLIRDLEELCPRPVIVQKGENHFQIAFDYLVNITGLEEESAKIIVNKSVLLDNLVPGFKVWNFFHKGTFGTFVTQGDAKVSPGKLHRIVQERLVVQKEVALNENKKLGTDIESLKNDKRNLSTYLGDINTKHHELSGKFADLEERHLELNKRWNSIFYKVDQDKKLVKEGLLKRGFLKKTKIDQVNRTDLYEAIDLRESNRIYVQAKQFDSKKIKKLTFFPKYYKKGVDYQVSINDMGSEAIVTILSPEKLKNEKVIISVGL